MCSSAGLTIVNLYLGTFEVGTIASAIVNLPVNERIDEQQLLIRCGMKYCILRKLDAMQPVFVLSWKLNMPSRLVSLAMRHRTIALAMCSCASRGRHEIQ